MNTEISKSRFKAQALEIFRRIETSGEAVVITDHGHPSLIIRRFSNEQTQPLERLKGTVLHYEEPFSPVADTDWEALQ